MSIPSTETIVEDLSFFDSWEERYKYIIDLGRELPEIDAALKTDERLVKGCQSNVWLAVDIAGERMQFAVDSDAHIVKGLLVLVLAAYHNKTAKEIVEFDIQSYFAEIDLERHLSPTRGNGLRAIVAKIQQLAKASLG
ncbi:SufE family protein [Salinibius halmophilus]|uniref:SufE family protein n=1 Tax=Salinibius halmophilus TaxID=1853216 RepID=UPI000E66BB75|nr:SufE family protein [Salinibius halmophilus]